MRNIKYIKSIRLINFQSHIDNTIELEKGLNVIVGPSDSGKTAIIRAIIWVLFDEPLGDSIIRIGEKEASVIITMYDGSYVKKSRKTRSVYELYDSLTGKKEEFQGSKGDVKKRVANILGLRFSSDNEKDSYNIHDQLSPTFLISEGPAGKAQAIGRLVGIDILDEAVADTRKDIVQKKQAINASLIKKEELEETIASFNDLEDEKLSLFKANENLNIAKSLNKKLENLKKINTELISIKEAVGKNKKTIDDMANVLQGEEYLKDIDYQIVRLKSFNGLLKRRDDINKQIFDNKEILIKSEKIISNEGKIQELEIKNKRYLEISKLFISVSESKERKKIQEKILKELSFIEKVPINEISNDYNIYFKASNLLNDKRKLREEIIEKSVIFNKHKKLDLAIDISDEATMQIEKYNTLKKILDESKNNILRIKNGKTYTENIKMEVEKIANSYVKELKANGRCPTCLSEIDDIKVNKIVSELEV